MSETKEHFVEVKRTARYYTVNEAGPHIRNLWFVFHGYGQLGQYFIKHFESIDDGKTLVVAPEALSKLYVKDFTGRIGASWMTREDRDNEIKDYIGFFDIIFEEMIPQLEMENVKLNFLGFSQGTATMCRWLNNRKLKADNIILWAGEFPKDVSLENNEVFKGVKFHFVYGNEDEFLGYIDLNRHNSMFEQNGVAFNVTEFEGKHEMKPELLAHLVAKFD